jgi:DNA-binding XRE family transcriptional regulator
MEKKVVGNHLRVYRRRAGLSQPDLAEIVGHAKSAQIARHEKNQSIPPLLTAIAYEAVFDAPISKLFPGLYESVLASVEIRLDEFEAHLRGYAEADKPRAISHQLIWLAKRRDTRKA